MNLEQVKDHFKFAKEVKCAYDSKDIYTIKSDEIIQSVMNEDFVFKNADKDYCILYNSDTNQLAEILTYIFERGEEVSVADSLDCWDKYKPARFLTFGFDGSAVVQFDGCEVSQHNHIRKLTPESKLEPQLSELKKVAEENGMSVTVIFNQK